MDALMKLSRSKQEKILEMVRSGWHHEEVVKRAGVRLQVVLSLLEYGSPLPSEVSFYHCTGCGSDVNLDPCLICESRKGRTSGKTTDP